MSKAPRNTTTLGLAFAVATLTACGASIGPSSSTGDGGEGGVAAGGSGGVVSTGGRGGGGGSGGMGSGGMGTDAGAGRGGSGGSAGSGAADAGAGGAGAFVEPTCTWPTAAGSNQSVSATIKVSGMMDGGMKRFVGTGALGTSGQAENQPPMFELASGATLANVIIGNPAADGVHCKGTCTLKNVWWEDVGEDAATLEGSSDSQVMTIDGGGAKAASDKVFQHNGPGKMVIQNFCVSDFGKLYRSCGNCGTQYTRHVLIQNVSVTPSASSQDVAGVNANYNDTAEFHGVVLHGRKIAICERYTGNDTGAEPTKIGSGADGAVCKYADSDIIYK